MEMGTAPFRLGYTNAIPHPYAALRQTLEQTDTAYRMQTVAGCVGIGEVNNLLVAGLVVYAPVFLIKIHSDAACAA